MLGKKRPRADKWSVNMFLFSVEKLSACKEEVMRRRKKYPIKRGHSRGNKKNGGHQVWPQKQTKRGRRRKVKRENHTGHPCFYGLSRGSLLFLSLSCPQRCNNSLCSQCQYDDWRGRKNHTHTDYAHTLLQLLWRWLCCCKQASLNNEIHIKYKADQGIEEPAVPQQTLTLTKKVGYYTGLDVFYHQHDSYNL